jgi:hypothetical protein
LNNFNPDKNYFLRIGGKFQAFLSEENGSFNGRVGAMIHPEQPLIGLIGLFECVEEEAVAFELLDAAINWLKVQNCNSIVGPIDFSIFKSHSGISITCCIVNPLSKQAKAICVSREVNK